MKPAQEKTAQEKHESLIQLAKLATMIAIEAPISHADWTLGTVVSWSLIDGIRLQLEKDGVNWRALRKRAKELEAERKASR